MTRWIEGKNPFFQVSPNDDGFSVSVVDDPKAAHFDFVNSDTIWHESDHIFHKESLPIEISRGCIFSCSFCAYPLNGKKKLDYTRDPVHLIDEFTRNYELFGTTEYIYCDDTHNDSAEKLETLYNQVYSKLKFKIRFSTYIRLDLIAAKPHTAQLLLDSGISCAYFGLESLNYDSTKAVGKGIRPERTLETLHMLKELWDNQVTMDGGFIIGLPYDTEETLNKWTQIITEPEFPMDSMNIAPLGMVRNGGKMLWKSEFDLNPEKYGYYYPDANQPTLWENKITGLNFTRANEISKETIKRVYQNKKNKPGQFAIPALASMGYKYSEFRDCIPYTGVLSDIEARRARMTTEYYNKLLGKTS
jgi:radical SAM superfamily enzyme YgiQ (UPF0313 family)